MSHSRGDISRPGHTLAPRAAGSRGLVIVPVFNERGSVGRLIERLRRDRLADTPEFRRLHGVSMGIYTLEAAVLLGAGLVIPSALGPTASPRP